MKKAIVLLSLVAILGFGALPANAILGVPDDMPGRDILVPMFYVSMPGFGNDNTLITITDVKGNATIELHVNVFTTKSAIVYNETKKLTKYDVLVEDGASLIARMSPGAQAALATDTDGDGTKDHWIGYILYENHTRDANELVSHLYQVDLLGGQAAGFKGIALETDVNAADPDLVDLVTDRILFDDFFSTDSEAFNALALARAKDLTTTTAYSCDLFFLYPRYYLHDAVATNHLILWTDANVALRALHCNVFNEDEGVASTTIPYPDELNIINVASILPAGLHTKFGKGGWIEMSWDVPTPAARSINYLAWSWQRAYGGADLAWSTIFTVDRDVE